MDILDGVSVPRLRDLVMVLDAGLKVKRGRIEEELVMAEAMEDGQEKKGVMELERLHELELLQLKEVRDYAKRRLSAYLGQAFLGGFELLKLTDGRSMQHQEDGTKLITYLDGTTLKVAEDGTRLQTDADGSTLLVHIDGTMVQTFPDGSKLWGSLSGVTNWNTRGVQTFSGGARLHRETVDTVPHATSGGVLQTFADGMSLQTHGDGTRIQTDVEGNTLQINTDGTMLQTFTDGTTMQIAVDGTRLQTSPDGTTLQTFLDGTTLQVCADGTRLQTGKDGLTLTVS